MELSRNWHWMWSTFYFNKKTYGYFKALAKVSRSFLSSIIKMIYYFLILNKDKRKIYYQRFSGLFNSILGKNHGIDQIFKIIDKYSILYIKT